MREASVRGTGPTADGAVCGPPVSGADAGAEIVGARTGGWETDEGVDAAVEGVRLHCLVSEQEALAF